MHFLNAPIGIQTLESKIVTRMGNVLRKDLNNHKKFEPRFCVVMDLMKGWVTTIGLLRVNGENIKVVVDFEKYPFKCHFCGGLKHLLGDCQSVFTCKTSIK